MSLADVITDVRLGIVRIEFYNQKNERIGSGTGFLCKKRLLTNHHVFLGHQSAHVVALSREQLNPVTLSAADFAATLRSGSAENSFDYAVLELPELIDGKEHQFVLEPPGNRRIGDEVGVLGFPLEHQNLTFHRGVISSFYDSNITKFVQLDASVNAGNSGGPVIDTKTGAAFAMVTRKATGLTRTFDSLRHTIRQNIQVVSRSRGMISMGGFDPIDGFVAGQNQILATLDEIQRQANVGIGYAISAEHLLADTALPNA
jgi:S1-C subfamily serine protease